MGFLSWELIKLQWQDFDLEGRARVPVGFYLVLLYLSRGYLTWVVSLTYSQDRSLLLSMIYPSASLFTTALLTGVPALIAFILFALKKQKDKPWYQWLWPKMSGLLLLALIFDLVSQAIGGINHLVALHWFQVVLFISGGYLLWFWLASKRVGRFFRNYLVS